LTYKAGTDVVEQAAGFLLAKELAGRGVKVIAFDPAYGKNWPPASYENLRFAANAIECIDSADVVVLATSWPEFNSIPRQRWTNNRNHQPRTVIDCWRTLQFLHDEPGVHYLGLGLGEGFV
jgi:UDPglucose 6-dehydrogenase